MNTSLKNKNKEGLLHMSRGRFNASVYALEQSLIKFLASPRKIFDRFRTDRSFIERIALSMHTGGYGVNITDILTFRIHADESGINSQWKVYEKSLTEQGFSSVIDSEVGKKFENQFEPIVGKQVLVHLISIPNKKRNEISIKEIINLFDMWALRPLTAIELQTFAYLNPSIAFEHNIVALGSTLKVEGVSEMFLELSTSYEHSKYHPCNRIESGDVLDQVLFAAVSKHIQ